MRKKGLLGLFIALLTFTALGFVACEKKTEVKPIPHTHNFTRKQAKDEFIKTPATCTEKAEYYVSCACGEKSEETFFGNARLGHTGEDCTRCGNHVVTYGLEYELSEDRTYCTVTGADGDYWVEDLVIPATYQGFPVRAIANEAFREMDNIKSVTLGANIIDIGGYAFYKCYNLETVVFNERLETISGGVFSNCTSLIEIALPNSVTWLGSLAFYNCSELETVILSDSLDCIEESVFEQCYKIQTETIDGFWYIGSENNPYLYLAGVRNRKITQIQFNENCKFIGDDAFASCYDLTEITIPSTIKGIGRSAFSTCSQLQEIVIPDTVNYLGSSAFFQCMELKSVSIGNGITTLRSSTFVRCRNLTDVRLSNALCSINEWVFSECQSLTSITIPESVRAIGKNAFE